MSIHCTHCSVRVHQRDKRWLMLVDWGCFTGCKGWCKQNQWWRVTGWYIQEHKHGPNHNVESETERAGPYLGLFLHFRVWWVWVAVGNSQYPFLPLQGGSWKHSVTFSTCLAPTHSRAGPQSSTQSIKSLRCVKVHLSNGVTQVKWCWFDWFWAREHRLK